MKLVIFGGSGKTGKHIIQQAIDAGYEVVALVRTSSKLVLQHSNLKIVQGDILDADHVESVIEGADAIISVLGPSSNKPDFTITRGIDIILKAMQRQGVRRIIISVGAGVREPNDKPKLIDRFFGLLLNVVSRNVVADMEQVVQKIKSSNRDWTIVRVPMLTDKPAQGTLKTGYVGDINPRLARADLAAFMVKQIIDTKYLKQAPAISN